MFSVLNIACFVGNLLDIPQEQEQLLCASPDSTRGQAPPRAAGAVRVEEPALPSSGSPRSRYVCAEVCLLTISTSHRKIFD